MAAVKNATFKRTFKKDESSAVHSLGNTFTRASYYLCSPDMLKRFLGETSTQIPNREEAFDLHIIQRYVLLIPESNYADACMVRQHTELSGLPELHLVQ